MDEIRVGVIGFGFMGKTHTYGYKTIPLYYPGLPYRITLAGVCTRTMESAERARDEYGFGFATDDPSDIINDPDIDAINVCTPNNLHKNVLLAAIRAGKHIYCDKPLVTSYAESREVLDALAANPGVINQVALQYRFFPATMRAKELMDEGRIGRVLSFRCEYLHSGSVDPKKPIGWKQDISAGGGGVLFDLGSHALDLMHHLMGEFASVSAATSVVYKQRPDRSGKMVDIEADDLAVMTLRLKDGALGTVEASKVATGANDELRFEIHGDKGAIRFNLMEPNWLDFYDNTVPDAPLGGTKGFTRIECVQRFRKPGGDFPSSKLSIGWIRAHVHCLFSFTYSVYNKRPASPSFADGAYIQRVMEKAYESARAGRWLDL